MKKIIHTLFPSPWLSVALALMWLVLNHSLSRGHIALAIILGWFVPVFTASLRPTPITIRHPLVTLKLFLTVGYDVIVSNIVVAMAAAKFGKRKPSGDFIRVPLELSDPNGLTALAAICTVIPGTIWSELALDRSAVLIHVFDLKNPQAEIIRFKNRYEKPLMEIFQ